jgi:DNA-binding FadR family transcriptional regulator
MAKLVPGENLSDKFVSALLREIVKGERQAGTQLPSEGDLALQYGVSRTVVREGIRELVALGMIAKRQGQRSFTTPREEWNLLDPRVLAAFLRHNDRRKELLHDLFAARLLIECYAAATAAIKRDEEDLALMQQEIETMAAAMDDPEAFVQADFRFHARVQQAARNLIVSSLVAMINELLMVSRRFTKRTPPELEGLIEDHRAIFAAIEQREPAKARQAMSHHLLWIAKSADLHISQDDVESFQLVGEGDGDWGLGESPLDL